MLISLSKSRIGAIIAYFQPISATIFVTTATVKVKQITDYYVGLHFFLLIQTITLDYTFFLIIQLKEIGETNFLYLAWYVKRMVKDSGLTHEAL